MTSSDMPVTDDAARRERNRLFVAVWPTERVLEVLSALPRPDHEGVRWMPPENWHITLRFLGDAPEGEVTGRLRQISLPAATAVVGPTVTRLGRDAVVVPVGGLDHLAAAITEATADLGRSPGPRPFNGHLTLARLRGRSTSTVVGSPVSAEFDVGEVAVVDSTTRPTGATYRTLARIPAG